MTTFFQSLLNRSYLIVTLTLAIFILFYGGLNNFKLDASSEALVIEGDSAFKTYREAGNTFGNDDFLIVTFTPNKDIFSKETLKVIGYLENDLTSIHGVESVLSILDAPIFFQPKVGISDIADNIKDLKTEGINFLEAAKEISNNPIYSELIISKDGKTTAMQIVIEEDPNYRRLINERYDLQDAPQDSQTKIQIESINKQISNINDQESQRRKLQISQIRSVLDEYREHGTLFLGGASMIAVDMMEFIESDLLIFGLSVALIFALLLFIFFRRISFVFLTLINAGITTAFTASFLGFMDWKISVVSSNFIALLLILTISLTVHVLVRFNELSKSIKNKQQAITESCKQMAIPCFFAAFTTGIAFISLMFGDIKPVIEFGKMMAVGISIAYVSTFVLLPVLMNILIIKSSQRSSFINRLPPKLASVSINQGRSNIIISVIVVCLLVYGITLLKVENRFIDYFSPNTEIYQGMYLLDEELGGTATLDVIIDAPAEEITPSYSVEDDLFEEDLFEDDSSEASGYWWNSFTLKKVESIHDYLDDLPEVGKVLSIASGIKLARLINDDQDLNDLELALLRSVLPEDLKDSILYSYINKDDTQVRISTRIYETSTSLNRNNLINKISNDLINNYGLDREQFRITGLAVLYNNMLQSLFSSQIKSLVLVFITIGLMFLILFRSFKVAILGLIPNVITASSVLGLLGLFSIPLDIMTITVAAISVGMAVDNTIHYLYRYRLELQYQDSNQAISTSHDTVGRAILYTAITISIGFLVFTLSNFSPTVLFGTFTAIALTVSLIASMILLPYLLKITKVFINNSTDVRTT